MLGSSADLERVWSGEAASVVKERAAAVCFFFFTLVGRGGAKEGGDTDALLWMEMSCTRRRHKRTGAGAVLTPWCGAGLRKGSGPVAS